MKNQIQKLGKSMLLPVAAMPLAGILLRLSADDLLDIPAVAAAGNAVFDNLDILFALGIVIGFANTKDKGIPVLTAFLSIATLRAGLAIADPELDMGLFGGLISGGVAAWTYNRFKNQKLPTMLSFFAGEKFPLTMVLIIQTIVSAVLGFIWPYFQMAIDSFAVLLTSMGALGVGLFLMLNRLLIPLGLHHVLNTYVYFDLGSYESQGGEAIRGEVTGFLHGDPGAGFFLSGFFVVLMFGIPAINLAIYTMANKNRKDEIKGLSGGNALTSFITNISEPTEFSFMFISPLLYVIHSIYAGLAGVVTYLLGIRIGFSFGASLVDYIINFRISDNAIYIIPVGLVFFALYYFTFVIIIKKYDLPTPGREPEKEYGIESSEEEDKLILKSKNYDYISKKILESFGGKDNIEEAFSCNTRLRIQVKDPEKVNEDRIKQMGVAGLVKPTDVNYQVIIGLEVTYIMEELKNKLD